MRRISILTFALVFGMASVSLAAESQSWLDRIKARFQKKEVAAAKKSVPAQKIKKSEPPQKQLKDMSKEEIISGMVRTLDREDSILSMIPGLKEETGEGGKGYYTYHGTGLDDLDKETLENIYVRVHQEGLRIRTGKLERQLETVRKVEAVQRVSRPPVPPAVNAPPQTPRPAQPPSRPPAPPAPPRR